jgi:hypothetical protein
MSEIINNNLWKIWYLWSPLASSTDIRFISFRHPTTAKTLHSAPWDSPPPEIFHQIFLNWLDLIWKLFLFSSRFFSFLIFFPFESGFELLFYEFFSAGSFGFLIFWFVYLFLLVNLWCLPVSERIIVVWLFEDFLYVCFFVSYAFASLRFFKYYNFLLWVFKAVFPVLIFRRKFQK